MIAGTDVTTPQERQKRVRTASIILGGCGGLILGALSPFFAYLVLFIATCGMVVSYPYISTLHLAVPTTPLTVDTTDKVMAAGVFTLATLILWQFYPTAQLLLCAGASALGSYAFIQYFVLDSQVALNNALLEAVRTSNLELITTLLARGADPFAPDKEQGNTAFHYAIKDHPDTLAILNTLRTAANNPPRPFKEVLLQTKELFNGAINQKWVEVGKKLRDSLRSRFQNHDRAAFWKAIWELGNAYIPVLKNSADLLLSYCRNRLASDKNLNIKNRAGKTPLELLPGQNILREQEQLIERFFNQNELSTPLLPEPSQQYLISAKRQPQPHQPSPTTTKDPVRKAGAKRL